MLEVGGPEELRSTPRITQLSRLSPVPGLPGRKPRALCLPERHRTSSAPEFSALRQPLVLLISSSSHYQEVADVSYRATSGVTASQARGTAHLVSGLPRADSASPRACRFARRAPSCVSFSLHVPHYRWTTPRASSKKPNLGKKKNKS